MLESTIAQNREAKQLMKRRHCCLNSRFLVVVLQVRQLGQAPYPKERKRRWATWTSTYCEFRRNDESRLESQSLFAFKGQ